jgi:mono/diheme cytochrome c family protein
MTRRPMKRLRMQCLIMLGLLTLLVQPGLLLAGDVTAGRALYQQYCSMCHGPQGKGDGPAASAMNPKPRDHTDGRYMNALSDAHLTIVISEGGAAVQRSPLMPSWKGTLSPQQIADVITYLRTLAVPSYKP